MNIAKTIFDEAESAKKEIDALEKQIRNLREYQQNKLREYRRESVNRVLDYIRTEYRAGRICDLETLLCHCQNKLNGNIDGTEIVFEDGHLKGREFELKEQEGRQ